MINNLTQIKQVLLDNKSDLAFIVGNGVNRYAYGENPDVSWNGLLLKVWEHISPRRIGNISPGISLTEFYDIMEVEAGSIESVRLKIVDLLKQLKPTEYHKWLQKEMIKWNAPLLTTNFDRNLDNGLRFNILDSEETKFTDFYPWNVYFSNTKLCNPLIGFGVWHINGMVEYRRSIRLSLSEYVGLSARVRSFLHDGESLDDFYVKDQTPWKGHNTWLHIIFNKSLCVFGLSLDENETFLRWLLIERTKYFINFPARKKLGWYICRPNEISEGKRLYLEYIGFELVELNHFDDIYKGIIEGT